MAVVARPAVGSWSFDGSATAGLDYGDLGLVTIGQSGSFSCFCAVRLDTLDASDKHFIGKLDASGTGWQLGLIADAGGGDAQRFRFLVSGGSGAETERSFDVQAGAGTWHAIGGSFAWDDPGPGDGTGTMTLFVDGVDDSAPPRFDHFRRPGEHTFPVTVGFDPSNVAATMNGRVDYAAVWDGVALTAGEHQLLAAGADPRTIRPDRLVFFATLEEADAADRVTSTTPTVATGAAFSTDRWPDFVPLLVGLGEVTPTSIRLFSHTGRPGVHRVEYTAGAFPGTLTPAFASDPTADHVVPWHITGLMPDTTYAYRLVVDGEVLDATTSSFTTAPAGDAAFSFTFASCTQFDHHQTPYPRFDMGVLGAVLARQPDFMVHAGDMWYADSGGLDESTPFNAWTMNDVSALLRKVRQIHGHRDFDAAHRAIPVYSMPDDHEFRDNISNVAGLVGADVDRYGKAFDRVLNWQFSRNPQRLPEAVTDGGLWYTFSYGGVDFFFLDVRTQRSDNTLPNTAAKKMLGPDDRQLDDLVNWLATSDADFKVILSPGLISRFGTTGNDAWGRVNGFGVDAAAVIDRIDDFDNVVFFGGDVHWSGAVRLVAHPDGDPAHDLYEFIGAPYGGSVSDPTPLTGPDLLYTYDGHDTQFPAYLLVDVDTVAAPPTLTVRIVAHDLTDGTETIVYTHPVIESRCTADCGGGGDDLVGVADLLAVLGAWGTSAAPCDTNRDGTINVEDLLRVLGDWGGCF